MALTSHEKRRITGYLGPSHTFAPGVTLAMVAEAVGVLPEQVALYVFGDDADWSPQGEPAPQPEIPPAAPDAELGSAPAVTVEEPPAAQSVAPWVGADGPPAPPLYYPPEVEARRREQAAIDAELEAEEAALQIEAESDRRVSEAFNRLRDATGGDDAQDS